MDGRPRRLVVNEAAEQGLEVFLQHRRIVRVLARALLEARRADEDLGGRAGENALQDQRIGVSRQTINAIESNKYVPSTVLALKMARLFQKTVDEILLNYEPPGLPF